MLYQRSQQLKRGLDNREVQSKFIQNHREPGRPEAGLTALVQESAERKGRQRVQQPSPDKGQLSEASEEKTERESLSKCGMRQLHG